MQWLDGRHANTNVVQRQVLSLSQCTGANPADVLEPDIETAERQAYSARQRKCSSGRKCAPRTSENTIFMFESKSTMFRMMSFENTISRIFARSTGIAMVQLGAFETKYAFRELLLIRAPSSMNHVLKCQIARIASQSRVKDQLTLPEIRSLQEKQMQKLHKGLQNSDGEGCFQNQFFRVTPIERTLPHRQRLKVAMSRRR